MSVSQGQRSDVDCQRRWQQIKNPELVKGPWTQEEDERVKNWVSSKCYLLTSDHHLIHLVWEQQEAGLLVSA